ncbi:MAG: hypothetical protein K0S20_217 [Patescibacteria group bacterium]|jgi:hypothetical protein|nr:hypothetical protein [Patescibacteria group bacterium]
MKITQETTTYLEAANKQLAGFILSPLLIIAGLIGSFYLYSTNDTTVPWWIGLAVAALGLLVLIFNRSLVLVIDKQTNKVTVTTKTLFGGNVSSHDISEAEKIQLLSEYRQSQTSSSTGTTRSQTNLETSLFLVLRNGQRILLANGVAPSLSVGMIGTSISTPGQDIGQKIAAFISIPFEATGAVSPLQAGSLINGLINNPSNNQPSQVESRNDQNTNISL